MTLFNKECFAHKLSMISLKACFSSVATAFGIIIHLSLSFDHIICLSCAFLASFDLGI